jgi:S-adenosylmethionine hydrolase
MKKLIVLADWSADSFTSAEFEAAYEGFAKDPYKSHITFVSSTPSTIHASYLVNQLVYTEERLGRPHETVVFHNIDPRLASVAKTEKAQGAEFLVIRLTSGVIVCGPNAGYDFSMIRAQIDQVFVYRGLDRGSQFRSRDLYARVCAHVADGMEDEMDLEEVALDVIPVLEGDYVGHVDNYGNIKTTLTREDLKGKYELGEEITVRINNVEKKAVYTSNLFGEEPGTLVFYPGSTGRLDNPYLEVSIWRHFTEDSPTTGAEEFGNPKPGTPVEIDKA